MILEREDVEAEFWRGVLVGLASVRMDMGDPIAHLVQRGVWQVKSVIREEIGRKVVQSCSACGRTNGKYDYRRLCAFCGAKCENVYRMEADDSLDETQSYVEDIASLTLSDVRNRLNPKQNQVLEALLGALYEEPESPMSAAARTLNMSRQRLHKHLDRIRQVIGEFTS